MEKPKLNKKGKLPAGKPASRASTGARETPAAVPGN